ncbi:MAG: D-2-hydroxyacid dehydrogenase family protein [Thalassospira sp.]|uniref:D-2-hydroxyacid dehydrogenase family protein n=1 Tax=Thalassospira sp. TaxID=1912094 RepID=UPI001B032E27|nr:D-2-hydroxyacid dehydrogenase family protein [Thalassospira sp.]MBO6578800.1 D-2-hydroxyacid dehydrogenase family protein [Thalassospira sp.]MBO6802190.1 D-2-hydroxyacid dehydrogenase family protein [Thalassospira sp.]MBO6818389.1 D-2-hydroxyacid dehydrogenase family protein [Thalassospira sp.]MBO6888029.1 D-2-hydroxyacid dehydrogenase family protein [Thalassospira sp.]
MRIAILDDYQKIALQSADWTHVQNHGEITVFNDHVCNTGDLISRLEPFDVLCVMRERTALTGDILRALPNLRLIVTTGKRNDAIDVATASELGITVCGTESPSTATPELTFALMLALARNLIAENASMRAGGWQVGIGQDLAGSTLGIIGLGRLGAKVAKMAQAFDMHVCAWSANLTPERCDELGATHMATKEDLLRASDFVTIHQRLSDRTHGLIGTNELNQMKPTAYLINTSRGPIVDDTALIDALNSGEIAGAALDVYDKEPLPVSHPLRHCDGLLLSPHLGYVTRNTWNVFYGQTVEAILAWRSGNPIRVIGP